MGYAIFAARKLQLTSRISNLNFRIMALSQQQQSLASVSSSLQQCFSQLGMGMSGNIKNPIFSGDAISDATAASAYRDTMLLQGQYVNALSQMIMKPVAMQENQIEQERKRLETQLKAADAELKQVEESENKQIEKSAPKYA